LQRGCVRHVILGVQRIGRSNYLYRSSKSSESKRRNGARDLVDGQHQNSDHHNCYLERANNSERANHPKRANYAERSRYRDRKSGGSIRSNWQDQRHYRDGAKRRTE
jgi:hypothetical protein